MIIYTGRFQPFHNGHLSLIKRIRANYPEQKLCIAVIKDVPIDVKSEFDRTADGVLSKKGNPFNSEIVLTLIEKVLKSENIDNTVVTLMPRASKGTWGIITALFDCERTWIFTKNQSNTDEWEEKKASFYQAMGDSVIRFPIMKDINGSDIRILLQKHEYDKLKLYLHESVIDTIKNLGKI